MANQILGVKILVRLTYTLQLQSWVLKQSAGRVMHRAQVFMVKILPCGFVIHKNCNRKNDKMIPSHWNNLYKHSESSEKAASWLMFSLLRDVHSSRVIMVRSSLRETMTTLWKRLVTNLETLSILPIIQT